MENPTHSFRETNPVLWLIWSIFFLEENRVFFVPSILPALSFISMHSVLNTLSEYTYFYISKTLLHTLLLLVSKIVESLQCILNILETINHQ